MGGQRRREDRRPVEPRRRKPDAGRARSPIADGDEGIIRRYPERVLELFGGPEFDVAVCVDALPPERS